MEGKRERERSEEGCMGELSNIGWVSERGCMDHVERVREDVQGELIDIMGNV